MLRRNDFLISVITPTRSWNSYLKQFCLYDICSGSSEYFDYPYYHSYTMDVYQNLISGDNVLEFHHVRTLTMLENKPRYERCLYVAIMVWNFIFCLI